MTIPLYTTRTTRRHCSSSSAASGFRDSTSIISSASRSRCCSCCEQLHHVGRRLSAWAVILSGSRRTWAAFLIRSGRSMACSTRRTRCSSSVFRRCDPLSCHRIWGGPNRVRGRVSSPHSARSLRCWCRCSLTRDAELRAAACTGPWHGPEVLLFFAFFWSRSRSDGPVHTCARAHVEAPTAARSCSGDHVEIGAYGFVRFICRSSRRQQRLAPVSSPVADRRRLHRLGRSCNRT